MKHSRTCKTFLLLCGNFTDSFSPLAAKAGEKKKPPNPLTFDTLDWEVDLTDAMLFPALRDEKGGWGAFKDALLISQCG